MPLQYLKDNNNTTTAVVIPIKDWEQITQIHQDINLIVATETTDKKNLKPSDYRGCISKETAEKMNAHIEQSRTEWSNNI